MPRIELERVGARTWRARLDGTWYAETGHTAVEAIGNLIWYWRASCGLSIEDVTPDSHAWDEPTKPMPEPLPAKLLRQHTPILADPAVAEAVSS